MTSLQREAEALATKLELAWIHPDQTSLGNAVDIIEAFAKAHRRKEVDSALALLQTVYPDEGPISFNEVIERLSQRKKELE